MIVVLKTRQSSSPYKELDSGSGGRTADLFDEAKYTVTHNDTLVNEVNEGFNKDIVR